MTRIVCRRAVPPFEGLPAAKPGCDAAPRADRRGEHSRRRRQRDQVEEHVAARRAARRIAVRQPEAGHSLLPAPRAERGAVELEEGDGDEHTREHGRRAAGEDEHDEDGHPERPDEVGPLENGQACDPPGGRGGENGADESARCA